MQIEFWDCGHVVRRPVRNIVCTSLIEPAIVCRNTLNEASMRASIRAIINQYRAQNPAFVVGTEQSLPGYAGLESAHVAVDPALAQLWLIQRNDVYRPHLVRMMAALARHETTVLMGWHAARTDAAWFCVVQQLLSNPTGKILIVVTDYAAGLAAYRSLSACVAALPAALVPQITLVHEDAADTDAHIVIATFQRLHRALLRDHDTQWKPFWSALQSMVFLDIQLLSGIAYQHARWVLMRIERIRRYHASTRPSCLFTATPAANIDAAIQGLCDGAYRIVPIDDIPTPPLFAVDATAGSSCFVDAAGLALVLSQAGYRVHIVLPDMCAPRIWEHTIDGVTHGAHVVPADVIIYAGTPLDWWARQEAMHGGVLAVICVHGNTVADQLLTHFGRADLPLWVCDTANAYVNTVHVLAAAAEIPLLEREVQQWAVAPLVARMYEQGFVRALANNVTVPAGSEDPHAEFDLYDAIGLPATLHYAGESISTLASATLYERWLAPRMAIPPWLGGMVVTARDIDAGSVTIAVDGADRLTIPIRTTRVTMTEPISAETQAGMHRVAVHDALVGMREWHAGEWHDTAYPDAFACTWYAPAVWWDIGTVPDADVPMLGWTFVAALQHWVPDALVALVPCYDASSGRLFLVEAQPGGTGIVQTVWPHLTEIMAAAQSVVALRAADEPLSAFVRVDAGWLPHAVCPSILREEAPATSTATALPVDDEMRPAPISPASDDPAAAIVTRASDASAHVVVAPSHHTDGHTLMAALLDTPIHTERQAGTTEPMRTAPVRPLWAQFGRIVAQFLGWVRGDRLQQVYVLGDAVTCVPYGDGVIVAVAEDGTTYIVATQQYGDVRIDPRRDLIMPRQDEQTKTH